MTIDEAKILLIKAGKKLVESGLIARTWGNISCRVNEKTMVITPSGMNYLSLTVDDIVEVGIDDLFYTGRVKPSSEKGIHAEVYKLFSHINFVIHTHQELASIISSSNINSISAKACHPALEGDIFIAKYALPGTKSLKYKVRDALKKSKTNAVIMKYHGAICFGNDYEEAFQVAYQLEKICYEKITKINHSKFFSKKVIDMLNERNTSSREFEVYRIAQRDGSKIEFYNKNLQMNENNNRHIVDYNEVGQIVRNVLMECHHINSVYVIKTAEVMEILKKNIKLKPLLDDLAQLVGTYVRSYEKDSPGVIKTLKKYPIVMIKGFGALCCGSSDDEAEAAVIVLSKGCKAYIGASSLGKISPINLLECILMRFVFSWKYSKKY